MIPRRWCAAHTAGKTDSDANAPQLLVVPESDDGGIAVVAEVVFTVLIGLVVSLACYYGVRNRGKVAFIYLHTKPK